MNLKRNASRPGLSTRLVRAGIAGLVSVAAVAGLAAGCLDRPICPDPAHPDACSPAVKNVFVTNLTQSSVDKIDLLFMIDNSASMADKQALLSAAVPQLVTRLVNPSCVDPATGAIVGQPPANPDDPCPTGQEREFSAIKDIHIGVVTSSLGGHGSVICTPAWQSWDATQDDKGHLIGLTRQGQTSYNSEGFLAWDPTGTKNTPPGQADVTTLTTNFKNMVAATGESGCGYEASLEGWYRFLVDPNPPDKVENQNGNTVATGPDQEVLTERANFLRPDSLVSIVMLTDENDCSVADSGLGWLIGLGQGGGAANLPAPTSVCATNPNDKCCHSCGQGDPAGCSHDPICDDAAKKTLTSLQDSPNLRCYDQKRRFGVDLLYPTTRYSNALSKTIICPDRLDLSCPNGGGVPNPLFTDINKTGRGVRGPDLVFLAGIVGVPWQDIATDGTNQTVDTLNDANKLTYFTSQELSDTGRWDVILGDPANYVPPTDPLMNEQVDPRTGSNPITNDAIAPPTAGPTQNKINGHEYSIPDRDDLQYACIFPLNPPKDCTAPGASCDCTKATDRPLCQDPATGTPSTTTQYFAKGYPGLRELEVLKEYGANSIVASICPKILDTANPDYGYNPAVAAIIDRLKSALNGKCLPRLLDVNPDTGQVPCAVVEALGPNQVASLNGAACNRSGRIDLNDTAQVPNGDLISKAVKAQLKKLGLCDVQNAPSCDEYLLCEIQQFQQGDPNLDQCQNNPTPTNVPGGYCYVADNAQGQHIGNPALLDKCSDTEKQLLRFVGSDVNAPLPAAGATYFIACTGAAFATGGGAAASPDGG